MSKKQQNIFNGFEQANTTPVPDILFDELLADLSGAELKVLMYIIRRTKGFKKDADAISLSQFENGIVKIDGTVLDRGCGLGRETICKALVSLEKRQCIKSEKQTDEYGAKAITVYSIRFKGEVVGKSDQGGSRKIVPPNLVGKTDQGSRKKRKRVVGKSDLQETVIQQTERKNVSADSTNSNASHSSLPSLDSLSTEDLVAEIHRREHEQLTSSESSAEDTQSETHADTHHIATTTIPARAELATTQKASQVDTASSVRVQRDTEPLVPKPDPEEIRVFNLLCEVFYAIPPEFITERIRKQCAALAPYVRNAEDMKSLKDYTRAQIMDDPSYKKKRAHLGNLVTFVNGWVQEREPLPETQQTGKPKVRKLTYEEKMAQPL